MPSTHKNLYPLICDFDGILQSFKNASKGRRYQPAILRYVTNLEENLVNIQNHLIWQTWQPGQAKYFTIIDPKMRQVTAPPFADRIVHHALHSIIEPIFDRRFIYDSYACRKGKGSHEAVERTQYFLRSAKQLYGDNFYVIKCDIKSYFASIDHDILLGLVKRAISDPGILRLFAKILKAYGFEGGVGLPVGALTSQLSANILLDALDHTVKDEWGVRHYIRYMDDFVLMVKDKKEAKRVMGLINQEVNALGLTLNPKSDYFPWQRGVDFCGYRIWPTHKLPRKRTVKRARKRIAKTIKDYQKGAASFSDVKAHMFSFMAYMNRCDGKQTLGYILDEQVISRTPPTLKSVPKLPQDAPLTNP